MILSNKVQSLRPSPTLSLVSKAKELRAQGTDFINLAVGEPDFNTPEFVSESAIQAVREGFTKYTAVDGIDPLKKAFREKVTEDLGPFPEEHKTIVSTGAKQVIFNAFMATLNPEDEVLIPVPYWPSYPQMVQILGGKPVFLPPQAGTFDFDISALEKNISPKTKWLVLNAPSNPSGTCDSHDVLKKIGTVLKRFPRVFVLSDDIYRDIAYEDIPHIALSCPELKERLLIVNGVSKSFSMTGWRIGFGFGPSFLIDALTRLQSQQTSSACSIAQKASVAALENGQKWLTEVRATFKQRADLMFRGLNALSLTVPKLSGAFYCFPTCEAFLNKITPKGCVLKNDQDVAAALIDEAGVLALPGIHFGLENHLRISYATHTKDLEEALVRIKRFKEKLSKCVS